MKPPNFLENENIELNLFPCIIYSFVNSSPNFAQASNIIFNCLFSFIILVVIKKQSTPPFKAH